MKFTSVKLLLGLGILFCALSCKKPNSDDSSSEQPVKSIVGFDTISSDPVTMVLDPSFGCRIISFNIDGNEILTSKRVNDGAFGSTFWPAPQSLWGWPPIAEIDTLPYEKNKGQYFSKLNEKFKFLIIKEFKPNQDSSISVIYKIVNKSDTIQKVAPWEITRVSSGGITFFETDDKEVFTGDKPFGELKLISKDGYTSYTYDTAAVEDNKKSFAFSKTGWMAHLDGSLVLIKTFPNISKAMAAPNESEIELYANPNKKYIEIENQGNYVSLMPNDTTTYEVKWYLRKQSSISKNLNDFSSIAKYIRRKL